MTTNPMTDREREAFEQYIADVIYEMCDHDEERATVDIASALMPDGNGNYMSTWTCDRLDAWQARIEYEPIEPIVYARKEDIDAIAELEVSHPEQSWSLTAKAKQDAAYSIPLYGAALSTEAQPEVTKADEPDMFWDADNPEDSFSDSPHEMACTLSDNVSPGEEAVFDVQCAISIANRKMRVKVDMNGDVDWEWVDDRALMESPQPSVEEPAN